MSTVEVRSLRDTIAKQAQVIRDRDEEIARQQREWDVLNKLSLGQTCSVRTCHEEIDKGLCEIKRLQGKLDEQPRSDAEKSLQHTVGKQAQIIRSLCERKGELEEEKEYLKKFAAGQVVLLQRCGKKMDEMQLELNEFRGVRPYDWVGVTRAATLRECDVEDVLGERRGE